MKELSTKKGIFFAILAAVFYAINSPLGKLLLNYMPPTLMAGFLYLGAGLGMLIIAPLRKVASDTHREERLTKKELPFTVSMILLDILAPILLMFGLKTTFPATASLLNNFEIVATAIVALAVFKETISRRLWFGIVFVTISCAVLSVEDLSSLTFSYGSLLILLAAVCWGFENNCTRKISSKDPLEIVLLKGVFSGLGSLIIGLIIGERITYAWSFIAVMAVGFVAYGLSIYFYVYAQRILGATRTSSFYAISPFIGAVMSFVMFHEKPDYTYFIALVLMIIGAFLSSNDKPIIKKRNRNQK